MLYDVISKVPDDDNGGLNSKVISLQAQNGEKPRSQFVNHHIPGLHRQNSVYIFPAQIVGVINSDGGKLKEKIGCIIVPVKVGLTRSSELKGKEVILEGFIEIMNDMN